jgi:hypothetical protein
MTNAEITKKIATNKKVADMQAKFSKLGFVFRLYSDNYMMVYGRTREYTVTSFDDAKSLLKALKAQTTVLSGIVVRRPYSDQWVCLY